MDLNQIIVTSISAIIPAIISYFAARYKGKFDLQKANESNKADIEKLIKQHEINLEALKEQHKMEMESKEKDHEHNLQLMQKEYELKTKEQQQFKSTDIINNALNGLVTDLLNNPNATISKINELSELKNKFSAPI